MVPSDCRTGPRNRKNRMTSKLHRFREAHPLSQRYRDLGGDSPLTFCTHANRSVTKQISKAARIPSVGIAVSAQASFFMKFCTPAVQLARCGQDVSAARPSRRTWEGQRKLSQSTSWLPQLLQQPPTSFTLLQIYQRLKLFSWKDKPREITDWFALAWEAEASFS